MLCVSWIDSRPYVISSPSWLFAVTSYLLRHVRNSFSKSNSLLSFEFSSVANFPALITNYHFYFRKKNASEREKLVFHFFLSFKLKCVFKRISFSFCIHQIMCSRLMFWEVFHAFYHYIERYTKWIIHPSVARSFFIKMCRKRSADCPCLIHSFLRRLTGTCV